MEKCKKDVRSTNPSPFRPASPDAVIQCQPFQMLETLQTVQSSPRKKKKQFIKPKRKVNSPYAQIQTSDFCAKMPQKSKPR